MRQTGNLLQDIVGSYVGALIQREHIKNKRLDDIMTTAGNAQQSQIESMQRRIEDKYGGGQQQATIAQQSQSDDYGAATRQLGVAPYPQAPSTTNLVAAEGVQPQPQQPNPPEPPPTDNPAADPQPAEPVAPPTPPPASTDDDSDRRGQNRPQQMSPMKAALLGGALTAASIGTGAAGMWAVLPKGSTDKPPVEQPGPGIVPGPAPTDTADDRDPGVDILVR